MALCRHYHQWKTWFQFPKRSCLSSWVQFNSTWRISRHTKTSTAHSVVSRLKNEDEEESQTTLVLNTAKKSNQFCIASGKRQADCVCCAALNDLLLKMNETLEKIKAQGEVNIQLLEKLRVLHDRQKIEEDESFSVLRSGKRHTNVDEQEATDTLSHTGQSKYLSILGSIFSSDNCEKDCIKFVGEDSPLSSQPGSTLQRAQFQEIFTSQGKDRKHSINDPHGPVAVSWDDFQVSAQEAFALDTQTGVSDNFQTSPRSGTGLTGKPNETGARGGEEFCSRDSENLERKPNASAQGVSGATSRQAFSAAKDCRAHGSDDPVDERRKNASVQGVATAQELRELIDIEVVMSDTYDWHEISKRITTGRLKENWPNMVLAKLISAKMAADEKKRKALSLWDYIQQNDKVSVLNISLLVAILGEGLVSQEHKNIICELYDKLKTMGEEFDSRVENAIVTGLSKTHRWRECLDICKEGSGSHMRVIQAALSNGDETTGYHFLSKHVASELKLKTECDRALTEVVRSIPRCQPQRLLNLLSFLKEKELIPSEEFALTCAKWFCRYAMK